jgi:hypothetical protein
LSLAHWPSPAGMAGLGLTIRSQPDKGRRGIRIKRQTLKPPSSATPAGEG